jgi:hypothetical protein
MGAVGLIGAAALTAGATAYSASQAKSSAGGINPSAIKQYSPYTIPAGSVNQVNPLGSYTQALQANTNLLPSDESLTSNVNSYDYAQANHYYNKIQPYFSNLQSQIGQNASQLASGQLPSDVQAQVQRNAAAQGVSGGFGYGAGGNSTGFLANLNVRNLGLTSLNLMQQGDQLGMQANSQAQSLLPQMMNPSSQFVSPTTLLSGNEFNAGQLNSVLSQNAGYINQANAANAGAQNAALQYNAGANQSAALAGAGIEAQGANQLTGLLGKYLSNNSGGTGGLFGGGSSSLFGSSTNSGFSGTPAGTAIDSSGAGSASALAAGLA